MLSEQTLRRMMPAAGARLDAHLPYIVPAMIKGRINTPDRIAAFLAQLAHESGEFRYMEELADGSAYEGRADLGNVLPGDGPRFKGHGPIQITGRANHRACGGYLGLDLEANPLLLTRPEYGTASAVWFWTQGNGRIDLNLLADRGWFKAITKVINGGLNWGTSAEMLNHYHFKYHYYRPDLVIINEGGNDAQGYTLPYYHPDNSNWRQPLVNLRPLPRGLRWLAYPRLGSLVILNVFYSDQLKGGQFVIRNGAKPSAPWFKPGGQLVVKPREMPREHLSFLHNIRALIRSVQADGAQVLLVPFRAAPKGYRGKDFELSQILRHEKLFQELAAEHKLGFAPFPASAISPGNWTDHCHLNAAGEREKATHIAAFVRPLMQAAAPR